MKDVVKTDINRVHNIKRNRRRKRNNSIYYLLVFLLVMCVGIALSMTLLFNISDISVVGQSQYKEEEIIEKSGISIGDNLVRTDIVQVKENIISSLMYIDEVRIKKAFPDRIIIEVRPSVPTAMIEYGNTYLLISMEGKILEKLSEPSKNVPVIKGYSPEIDIITKKIYSEDEKKDETLKEVCRQISEQNLYSMIDFDISDVYSISANYQNRISIRLGNSSELDYKLRYAYQILTEQLPVNKEGYLIFRANNQYQYVSNEDMEKHIEEIAAASGIVLGTEPALSQTGEAVQTEENQEQQ